MEKKVEIFEHQKQAKMEKEEGRYTDPIDELILKFMD